MNGQIKYHLRRNSNIDYKTCLDQRATWDFKGFYHLVQTMLLKTRNVISRSCQYTQLWCLSKYQCFIILKADKCSSHKNYIIFRPPRKCNLLNPLEVHIKQQIWNLYFNTLFTVVSSTVPFHTRTTSFDDMTSYAQQPIRTTYTEPYNISFQSRPLHLIGGLWTKFS